MGYRKEKELGWNENAFYVEPDVEDEEQWGIQPDGGNLVYAPVWDPEQKKYSKRQWMEVER